MSVCMGTSPSDLEKSATCLLMPYVTQLVTENNIDRRQELTSTLFVYGRFWAVNMNLALSNRPRLRPRRPRTASAPAAPLRLTMTWTQNTSPTQMLFLRDVKGTHM